MHAQTGDGRYECAEKHEKERLGEDQGERQELPLIRSGGLSESPSNCYSVCGFLNRSYSSFIFASVEDITVCLPSFKSG